MFLTVRFVWDSMDIVQSKVEPRLRTVGTGVIRSEPIMMWGSLSMIFARCFLGAMISNSVFESLIFNLLLIIQARTAAAHFSTCWTLFEKLVRSPRVKKVYN